MPAENVIEEAVKALEKYGRHESWCLFSQSADPPRHRCDCGFASALASLRKAAEGAEVLYRDNKQMCFALPEDLLRCAPSSRAGWHRVLVLRIQDGAA